MKKGSRMTQEQKEKIRKGNLGKKISDETKKKMSLSRKGRHYEGAGFKKGITPWNKGKAHTKEARRKMSNNRRGKSAWNKGKKMHCQVWNKGIKCSNETKKKISKALKGKYIREKSHSWKGGITPLNQVIRSSSEYRLWRDDVFNRDNFTCQECGERGCYLHAHHRKKLSIIIKQYNIKTLDEAIQCSELWNINNGITYCEKCHKIIHKKCKV